MIRVCFDTKNEFYTYIATGVIMMILFHVVENIGMTIGLLPLTGIPLPFISQGGFKLAWKYDGDWAHYVNALSLQEYDF